MTQKRGEETKFKRDAFSYPPEMEDLVRTLQKERKLSSEITRLLAKEYKIKVKAT